MEDNNQLLIQKPTVLVVDDNVRQLSSATEVLEQSGFHAEGALGGKEALNKLSANEYDLLLLDLLMPDVDGFDVLRFLSEHDLSTAVVVCSGIDSPQDAARAFRLGAFDFIGKPYKPERLLATLRNAIESQQHKEALNALVGSMVGLTGQAFFDKATKKLCEWFRVDGANIGEIADGNRIRAMSMTLDGQQLHDYEYPLKGTPCYQVLTGGSCLFPTDICNRFPDDRNLQNLNIQGYAGVPIKDEQDIAIGILWVVSRTPLQPPPQWKEVLNIISAKASAEIQRMRAEKDSRESTRKFRALVETTQDFVWEVTKDGVYSYCSPQCKDILGYTQKELLGKTPFDLMPPQEAERIAQVFKDTLTKESSIKFLENINISKSGQEVVLETSAEPFFNEEGQLMGFRGIDRDITERKAAEKELERIFNLSPDMIGTGNLQGYFTRINQSFEKLLGYTEKELLGSPFLSFVHDDDVEKTKKSLSDSKKNENVFSIENRYHCKDDSYIWIDWRVLPLPKENRFYAVGRDITENKKAESDRRLAEDKFSLLLNSAAEGMFGIDTEGLCIFVNPACLRILGYDNETQVIGQNMHQLIHHTKWDGTPNPLEESRIDQAYRLGQGAHVNDEIFWCKDGTSFPAEYWSYPLHSDNKVIGAIVSFFDISDRKLVEIEREEYLREMGERVKELQCMFGITEAVRKYAKLDDTLSEAVRLIPTGWQYPAHTKARVILDEKVYTEGQFENTPWRQASDILLGNEKRGSVEVYFLSKFPECDDGPFQSQERHLIEAIAKILSEAIERKQAEAELEHLATHDVLTGLYNRKALEQRIVDELNRASRYHHGLSVLMLDLDHFKQVNDLYGHQAGDAVLRGFSEIINNSLRKTDYAVRFGGEEFIVVLPETPLSDAKDLGERLRQRIEGHPISIEGDKEVTITASIGVANFPNDAQSWIELLKAVDLALYHAKKEGRNCVVAASNSI